MRCSPQLMVPMPRAGTINPEAPNVRLSMSMIFAPCVSDVFDVHPAPHADITCVSLHCCLSLQKSLSLLYWRQWKRHKEQKSKMNSILDKRKKSVGKLVKERERIDAPHAGVGRFTCPADPQAALGGAHGLDGQAGVLKPLA